jgi:hypothetical protein
MGEGCVFCDQSWMRVAEIFIETRIAFSPRLGTRKSGHRPAWRKASCLALGQSCLSPIGRRSSS